MINRFLAFFKSTETTEILPSFFACRLFLDTIYSVEEKYNAKRVRLLKELANKPHTAPALLLQLKKQYPGWHIKMKILLIGKESLIFC